MLPRAERHRWARHLCRLALPFRGRCGRRTDHVEVPGTRIERDLREELAVRRGVVVHPHRSAPGRAPVVREALADIGIVSPIRAHERVDEIAPAIVEAPGTIPGQAGLSVDGPIHLRWNEVEPSDMGVDNGDRLTESFRPDSIRVDVDAKRGATLA